MKSVVDFLDGFLCTDKNLIVIAVTIVAMYVTYMRPDSAETIINSYLSGMFGMAVGQRLPGNGATNGSPH